MKSSRHQSLLATALLVASFHTSAETTLQDMIRGKCPSAAIYLDKLDAAHANAGNVHSVAPTYPVAATSFVQRANADEAARNAIQKELPHPSEASIVKAKTVDAENQRYLKQFIREHGIPNTTLVGDDGVRGVWLITQHADKDPKLQKSVLAAFKDAPAGSGVSMDKVAMLDDRVHLSQGQPQEYGSQMITSNGVLVPREPIDRGGIDDRRRKAGLMPLNDYVCMMNALPH